MKLDVGSIIYEKRDMEYVLRSLNLDDSSTGILRDMVSDLFETTAKEVNAGSVVAVPYIGKISKSQYKEFLRAKRDEIIENRNTLTYDEYVEYRKQLKADYIVDKRQETHDRNLLHRVLRMNRKKYDRICAECGKAFADVWIKKISYMAPMEQDGPDKEIEIEYEEP